MVYFDQYIKFVLFDYFYSKRLNFYNIELKD